MNFFCHNSWIGSKFMYTTYKLWIMLFCVLIEVKRNIYNKTVKDVPRLSVYLNSCNWNTDCDLSYCASMRQQDHRVHLYAEEQIAAESLSTYCKPVELYSIIQSQAVQNPSFRRRCLWYKMQKKAKKTVELSETNLLLMIQRVSLGPGYQQS